MSKSRVAVIMGGISSEHEISLKSGGKILEQIDAEAFEVFPITIGLDGAWKFPEGGPLPLHEAIPLLHGLHLDCAFLALHGSFGEDGRVQGMLDLLGVPYVGSGCMASGLAMDKVRSKRILAQAGIRVARDLVVGKDEWLREPLSAVARIEQALGYPCVVKSPCQGSSLGMAIPKDRAALEAVLPELFELDHVVMAEEYLKGVEVTCSVLDIEPGQPPRALPVTEIVPVTSEFFDYYAKYTPGACREITPARITPEETRIVQEMAVAAHRAIGCEGMSRSDMIIVEGEPVWLEANTIPGMTETSLLPQAAASAGISYKQLVGMLIGAVIRPRK